MSILRIHGPFLFGTTDKLALATRDLSQLQPIVIVRLRNMTAIDATGLYALEIAGGPARAVGTAPVAVRRARPAGTHAAPGQFVEHVGADNILPNVTAALQRAEQVFELAPPISMSINAFCACRRFSA